MQFVACFCWENIQFSLERIKNTPCSAGFKRETHESENDQIHYFVIAKTHTCEGDAKKFQTGLIFLAFAPVFHGKIREFRIEFRVCSRVVTHTRARVLVQVTIHRRLRIGRDSHLDQSEAYDIS